MNEYTEKPSSTNYQSLVRSKLASSTSWLDQIIENKYTPAACVQPLLASLRAMFTNIYSFSISARVSIFTGELDFTLLRPWLVLFGDLQPGVYLDYKYLFIHIHVGCAWKRPRVTAEVQKVFWQQFSTNSSSALKLCCKIYFRIFVTYIVLRNNIICSTC